MNTYAEKLSSAPLAEGAFMDNDYALVPIAQEAAQDPDLFSVIPREFTVGRRMLARTPVVNLIVRIIAPTAKEIGKRLLVTQAYKSREAKMDQWRQLRAVACALRGYNNALTLAQEYEVGNSADAWGSYRSVQLCPQTIAAMEQLKSERGPELEAIASKDHKSVDEITLTLLSFRVSNDEIDLPLSQDSGWSVFMSGGHLDLELIDLESGKPDFYGVPGDVLATELALRTIFEDDQNREAMALANADGQVRPYLRAHDFEHFGGAAFEMARRNIRLLQGLAIQCALIPWFGSTRTFSAPNFHGGKQAQVLQGYGDQAHSKKRGHDTAVWERVPALSPGMVEEALR